MFNIKSKSSIVECFREALREVDKKLHPDDEPSHIRPIVEQLRNVAFDKKTKPKDKIEALKLITEVFGEDLGEGLSITQMEDLIIDRGAIGYPWARDVEPDIEIRGRSRVACLYEGNVYLVGKIVQFKHTPETHIIEDQLTGELYEWQLTEVRHLSISECVSWINHINTQRQPDGFALPQGHIDKLKAQHDI